MMTRYALHEVDSAVELDALERSVKDGEAVAEQSADDGSTTGDTAEDALVFRPGEEQRIVRKLDVRVVGLVALLYLLSFLDRSNIGNAKIAGLMDDLQLTDAQFDLLLTAFYLTYIAFEWMALLFKLIPPHIYLATVVCAWGILASLQALSASYTQLLALRALLGCSEAAFTGVPFYLSFFFRRNELALRTGLFIAAAPLATACASSLAWLVTRLARLTPVAPWRMLLLVEGFPSVVVAWYCWRSVADSPGEARFLTARERVLAVRRLAGGDGGLREGHGRGRGRRALDAGEMLKTLRDSKSYIIAAMYFCTNVAFSSMPVFLPTIIQEMGHTSVTAQALSAPPYLFSFIVVLAASWHSDKHNARARYIISFALLAALGYFLVVLASVLALPSILRYLALYPACAGFFTCITLLLTWTLNNAASESGRGTGIALLQLLGQCGPLLGTRLFPASQAPLYVSGMAVCMGGMLLVAVLAAVLARLLRAANRRVLLRDAVEGGAGASEKGHVFMYIV